MSPETTATATTLTSTTAPGKVFHSRSELADHYKSDWHKYNLRRREAGLVMLNEQDFKVRWDAALALKAEKERSGQKNGQDHIKNKDKNKKDKKSKKQNKNKNDDNNNNNNNAMTVKTNSYDEFKKRQQQEQDQKMSNDDDDDDNNGQDQDQSTNKNKKVMPAALVESQENPEIDPCQSLFDSHTSTTIGENVQYMHKTYGFFVPDQECLIDVEGLVGYLHEKIKLGHYCLYCERYVRVRCSFISPLALEKKWIYIFVPHFSSFYSRILLQLLLLILLLLYIYIYIESFRHGRVVSNT